MLPSFALYIPQVESEIQVVRAALNWVQHDDSARRHQLQNVLAGVRLSLVPLAVRTLQATYVHMHPVGLSVQVQFVLPILRLTNQYML